MANLAISSTTERLVTFYDSTALEAIKNGETKITHTINVLFQQLQSKEKSSVLLWIPTHVNIGSEKCADLLAKEAQNSSQSSPTITIAIEMQWPNTLFNHTRKKNTLITYFNCSGKNSICTNKTQDKPLQRRENPT